jgi:ferredoxin/flavodoxin---NADP+ reductase
VYPILAAETLAPRVRQFEILAPRIAKKQLPGQFVILRVNETGERIPITIKASDVARQSITIVVQAVGKTTTLLNELNAGDSILDVVGPLGKPSEIENYGHCVVIGGGVGAAIALPTAKALRDHGNRVTTILGARTRDLILLEKEMAAASDELFVMTDDGSYGEKGVVTARLKTLIESSAVNYVLAIGPVPMMRAVAEVTRPLGIKTVVSLNAIMVDGTGMCGGCRVEVDGRPKFVCVDGPEFDGHKVNFDLMIKRLNAYKSHEQQAYETYKQHQCRIGLNG